MCAAYRVFAQGGERAVLQNFEEVARRRCGRLARAVKACQVGAA